MPHDDMQTKSGSLHLLSTQVAAAAEHLGRSGDEGLDGVIRQDTLGLHRIYVQAKRYAENRAVGRPEIQEFVGALQGAQADRGIFITTSRFTRMRITTPSGCKLVSS